MTISEQAAGAAGFIESMRGRESLSGPGSTLAATVEIREWLPEICRVYGIKSISDVPCGDMTWMAAVKFPEEVAKNYCGYDISAELVKSNREKTQYAKFKQLNAVLTPPDYADLIICRDFLVHLTYAHALQVLVNFKASGSKYLAVTTFPGVANAELQTWSTGWGWRALDMEARPFDLGPAIDGVKEEFFGDKWNRWTKLYRLNV